MVLITSVVGVVRYRQLPLSLRYLALLACFEALMKIVCLLFFNIFHVANLFLFPFISVSELTLLALAYRQVLQSDTFSRVMPWVLGLSSAYALLANLPHLHTSHYTTSLSIISDLLTIALAGLYFRKLLNELQVERLRLDPFFWVSAALVVHGLGDLVIVLFSNYLISHCSLLLQKLVLLGVRNIFNLLLYVSYFLALALRPPKSASHRA